MGVLSQEEIMAMGFESVGHGVALSDKASFYNCRQISIGNNVRIDDFCVISAGAGGIAIGNNVHVAVYTSLIGRGRILLDDFSNLSSRVSVYSSSDDYSGEFMTNPTVPTEFTGVSHADVVIGRHVVVGAGSVILPGALLEEGVAVGALSLVTDKCDRFFIYAGIPARKIRERKQGLLQKEQEFRKSS